MTRHFKIGQTGTRSLCSFSIYSLGHIWRVLLLFLMLAKKKYKKSMAIKKILSDTPKRMHAFVQSLLPWSVLLFFSLHKPNVHERARASIPTQSRGNVFFDAIVIGYGGQIELFESVFRDWSIRRWRRTNEVEIPKKREHAPWIQVHGPISQKERWTNRYFGREQVKQKGSQGLWNKRELKNLWWSWRRCDP